MGINLNNFKLGIRRCCQLGNDNRAKLKRNNKGSAIIIGILVYLSYFFLVDLEIKF